MSLSTAFIFIFCLVALPANPAKAMNISAYISQALKIKVLDGDGSDYTQMTLKIKQKAPSKIPEEIILDMGGGETISVPLREAERGPVPLKADKINFATIQASAANASGERTVRLKFNSRYAARAVKTDYDLQLKLVGPDKVPMVLLGNRALTDIELRLNKKVNGRSLLKMLFSPPKVAKVKLSTIGCSGEEVIQFVQRYHSADYPRRLGCRLKKLSKDEIFLLDFSTDVYGAFYLNGKYPSAEVATSLETAETFRSLGLNFSRLKKSDQSNLLSTAIRSGNRPLFDYFTALGLRPNGFSLQVAVKNYYQYDSGKRKLVVSPTGKYFYEKIKNLAPNDQLEDFSYTVLNWKEIPFFNSTMDALRQRGRSPKENEALLQYYLGTLQLALDDGWDPFAKVTWYTDTDFMSGYEMIRDSDGIFTPGEKRRILALLDQYAQKQAAAKPDTRALATINQSLQNLGAGCGCQRN